MNHPSIVLIGPRYSWKSSIGRHLHEMTGKPLVDIDDEIQHEFGTVSQIKDRGGWDLFRTLETYMILKQCSLHSQKSTIMIPGGGAMAHNQGELFRITNEQALRKFGTVVYVIPSNNMDETLRTLSTYIPQKASTDALRPALTHLSPVQELTKVVLERDLIYRRCADLVIETNPLGTSKQCAAYLQTQLHF